MTPGSNKNDRKGQNGFRERLEKQKQDFREGRYSKRDNIIKQKEIDLDRVTGLLEKLKSSKNRTVARFDEEINRLEETAQRMRKEINGLGETPSDSAVDSKTKSKRVKKKTTRRTKKK